jgi:protein ImuB
MGRIDDISRRFVTIWFPLLTTDWFALRRPELRGIPFVLAAKDHGRMVITAANEKAYAQGIPPGMPVADARALLPELQVIDDKPGLSAKLLKALAEWAIRFTPIAGVDPLQGLLLDVSGCTHLWGGEGPYLKEIVTRLETAGYTTRAAMADTIGAAWALTRYGRYARTASREGKGAGDRAMGCGVGQGSIIDSGAQAEALLRLPPEALRLEPAIVDRLNKLGLRTIGSFAGMSRSALRRRFGTGLLQRLDQALGLETETIEPVQPLTQYQERLPCLEPIVTATGIEIALKRLLETLCDRLQKEEKGLRSAVLTCYRVDGKQQELTIGTNRATHNSTHLFKLFEPNLETIEPDLGIELFVLDAPKVEDASPFQETLWSASTGLDYSSIAELLDKITGRFGANTIQRFLPDERHWPERSIKLAASLQEKPTTPWRTDRPRPIHLLPRPESIEVTAPIPDYPPMLFRYGGQLHKIAKADGPERIEREWWLDQGPHRDYYTVEDEAGARYWLFRSGHYTEEQTPQWFIHGFFA